MLRGFPDPPRTAFRAGGCSRTLGPLPCGSPGQSAGPGAPPGRPGTPGFLAGEKLSLCSGKRWEKNPICELQKNALYVYIFLKAPEALPMAKVRGARSPKRKFKCKVTSRPNSRLTVGEAAHSPAPAAEVALLPNRRAK